MRRISHEEHKGIEEHEEEGREVFVLRLCVGFKA
ncbi:hypothetical protein R84B8_00400 [Treponema sp. R8-4-B8]